MSVFMFHGFIRGSIPLALEEAAYIDGCTHTQTFFRIVFPLLKPIISTMVIMNAMAFWNDFLLPSLVLTDKKLLTKVVYCDHFDANSETEIVKKFKADTFRIMEEEPERLAEVKGVSERMAMEISSQVEEKRDMRQAMVFLQQYGISMNLSLIPF